MTSTLIKLLDYGQSYWLDNLTRKKITGGELHKRVAEQGLRGITSNPSIFNKAISESDDYTEQIKDLVEAGRSLQEIYEALTVKDVQDACDILRPVFDGSDGVDGFVSLEVSPHLARDTRGTMEEARRLFKAVDRPNCYIKIPGTREGLPAIEQMLYEGVNVNITLLFSIERYAAVAKAYIRAIQRRADEGKDITTVRSVASFFLSRIDVLTDQLLGHRIKAGVFETDQPVPESLLGKTGIASARLAYQRFKKIFSGEVWDQLARKGAKMQRPLWASTSTKDPLYSDVRYVESLIGPDTVNTLPDETIAAFADHGRLEAGTIEHDLDEAGRIFNDLSKLGIDIDFITAQLENEGIEKFLVPYNALLSTLSEERAKILKDQYATQEISFGKLKKDILSAFDSLDEKRAGKRLFSQNSALRMDGLKPGDLAYAALENLAENMGIDVQELLPGARRMRISCGPHIPARSNPGLRLGATLGVCARNGRDQVLISLTPAVHALGPVLEQLLGRCPGLTPVLNAVPDAADASVGSGVFVSVFTAADDHAETDRKLKALEDEGHPVIRITVPDRQSLGGEWCRWEVAAAVAGMVVGEGIFDPAIFASGLIA